VSLGPGTVFSGCNDQLATGDDLEFPTGQVFVPALGKNVSRPLPTVPVGKKLIAAECTVAGDEDHLRVIYVYTLRSPSEGLTPAGTETHLVSFDPERPGAPTANAMWPAGSDVTDFQYLVPSRYGFMSHGQKGIIGFGIDTLAPEWRSADGVSGVNFDGYVTADSAAAPDVDAFEWRLTFRSAKDGSTIGTCVGPTMGFGIGVLNHGFMVEKGKYRDWQSFYFDMQDAQFKGPVTQEGNFWGNNYIEYNRNGTPFIRVWDMNQNKVIFSLEGEQVIGLNIKNVYFAGNYLYIENDADSPVIDITTSQKVSSGWKVRPTDVIDRDWMLTVAGHVTNDYANCLHGRVYGCYEQGTLVRSPNGHYGGPWF
jgi:hypothetical protein